MKVISARVTDIEYERLKFYCDIHGGSISEFIRAKMECTLKQAEREDPDIWKDMEDWKEYHKMLHDKYIN